MKIISDELANVRTRTTGVPPDQLFGHVFKSDLEWSILGSTCELMIKANVPAPTFAEKCEKPDFKLYSKDGNYIGGIEVTEAMQPGFKRHAHFKNKDRDRRPQPIYPLHDPWETLRTVIQSKSRKSYPANTALLIYFDIWLYSFRDVSTPTLRQMIKEHLREPFVGCTHFTEVLVIDSGMKNLIRLSPKTEELVVD